MPNILLLSVDDLNNWTSVLRGYAGTVYTPNIERIASTAVTFENAFCTSPGCNMSRSSALSGMSPLTTGVLGNDDPAFAFIDPAETLPAVLRAAAWETATAGKVFHEIPDAVAPLLYDRIVSPQDPPGAADKDLDQSAPTAGSADIGYFTGDPATLKDGITTAAVTAFLKDYVPAPDSDGLFLSVGLHRPHYPWIVPKEYYDLYPLDQIVVPDLPPDDLFDIPGYALSFADPKELAVAIDSGEYRYYLQGYLAAVSYADAMIGRILDALEASAIADDTLVMLWSDHGYHLGEKGNIGKGTLWEEATRAELMISAPGLDPAQAGRVESQVVSLLDIFPTLADYAGIARPDWLEGQSLLPLVETGDATGLTGVAVTMISGSYSIRDGSYRYTRYEDGSEEVYDLRADPHEFTNRADDPLLAGIKAGLSDELDAHLADHGVAQNWTDHPKVLEAGPGGRVLIGGWGPDTLVGGDADNVYLIRDPGSSIVETADGGRDIVYARASYVLPENVEDMRGSAWFGGGGPPSDLRLLGGNALDNAIRVDKGGGTLAGAGGDDTLDSGTYDDSLDGGTGNDLLDAAAGRDTLAGGAGNDTLLGGTGDDLYLVSGGNDVIGDRAQDGKDTLKVTEGGGTDRIDVSAWGLDVLQITELTTRTGALKGQLITNTATGETITVAAVQGKPVVELLVAGDLSVMLYAGDVDGTPRPDIIRGTEGGDTIRAKDGNDRLLGRAGADLLLGGAGDDVLDGGSGSDTVSYADATQGVTVRLGADRRQQVTPTELDRLIDVQNLAGSAFADVLEGSATRNLLEGGAGDDSLIGGGGPDRLIGGLGVDLLQGGAGSDHFVFLSAAESGTTPETADRILDFRGADIIDLSGIDAIAATAAKESLVLALDATTAAVGQVRMIADGRAALLAIATGPGAEMLIRIDNAGAIDADSFVL